MSTTSSAAERAALETFLDYQIEETARHAGHADIIRESIDGARGRC